MSTQLYYASTGLERAAHQRQDEGWINHMLHHRQTRIVPVWRNANLIMGDDSPGAIHLTGDHARGLLQIAGEIALLGLATGDGDDDKGTAYFAIDLSEHELPTLTPAMGQAKFVDLREVGPLLAHREAALLAFARGNMYWHRHNRYCCECGNVTASEEAGRLRRCTNTTCGREYFPRTDPAVIMLVTRPGPEGGACLLARQSQWPEGMYSTLAGFVDQSESLEEAVAREVMEEAGIVVKPEDVEYRGSQPWPFPSSLMMGFRATASSLDIDTSGDELEDARWFTKTQIAAFPEKGLRLPRRDSIAWHLVSDWLEED